MYVYDTYVCISYTQDNSKTLFISRNTISFTYLAFVFSEWIGIHL